MVLSVLAVLLLGVVYLPRLYGTALSSLALARRCALQHASNGCDRDAVPEACAGLLQTSTGSASEAGALHGIADASPLPLPVLADAIDGLFGSRTGAIAKRDVRGPTPEARGSGGEPAIRVAAGFQVLCNARPQSPSQLARDLWDEWVEL